MSVKVEEFDEEHKILFGLINDFYDGIKTNPNGLNISKLLVGMKAYTKRHFRNEESVMQSYEYPDFESHKKEHDSFLEKMQALEGKFSEGKLIVSFEVTNLLKDWIRLHIQGVDKQYSDFLNSKGVR